MGIMVSLHLPLAILSTIPFLLLMSLFPGPVVYYLVGLHQGHDFISLLFISVFLVEGLMMIVASMVPKPFWKNTLCTIFPFTNMHIKDCSKMSFKV